MWVICYNICILYRKGGVVTLSPLRYFNSVLLTTEEGAGFLHKLSATSTNSFDPKLFALLITALILLICMSAFFSASETAFSTVNIMRLKNYVEEKRRGAKKALWIAEHYDRTLSTILVGNNFVNIAATTLAAILFSQLIKNASVANIVNTIGMTIIVLIFGEIMPKSIAKENAERFALLFSNPLYVVIKLMFPFVIFFIGIKKLFYRHKKDDSQPTVTESELESIIDTMEEEGVLDSDDADLIQSVLDIGERTIYDIMIPRVDVVAISIDMDIEEIKDLFFEYQYSRLPVYKDDKDHIIGILSERDFFTALLKGQKIDINKLVSTPLFVSKTMKVDDLIRKMQSEKKHLAIVSDEYGGTSGIVTMEDALEELVGEIYDEHDENVLDTSIIKLEENEYSISAEVPLDELFETLELGKTPDSGYSSVGGFVYSLAEEVPLENETYEYDTLVYRASDNDLIDEVNLTLKFTILEVVERRITRVKLEVIEEDKKKKSDEVIKNEGKPENKSDADDKVA